MTGPVVSAGDDIFFRVYVENTGNIDLDNVVVTDTDFTLNYVSGDLDTDGLLDFTETWIYETAVMDAVIGQHEDIATVNAESADNSVPDPEPDSDPAHYLGVGFNISGTKYEDMNGDGLTAGDLGLGGVTVFIDMDDSGTLTGGDLSDLTDVNGDWSFTGLGLDAVGKTVYEVLPGDYVQTLGETGYLLTNQSQTGLDFANFELFDFSGVKYEDMNGDGSIAGDLAMTGTAFKIGRASCRERVLRLV